MTTFKRDQDVMWHAFGEWRYVKYVGWVDGHPDWSVVDMGSGVFVHVETEQLEPVTPPCPWTEHGTLVVTTTRGNWNLTALLTDNSGWRNVLTGQPLDYDRDIAPFNPVRLVPEGSEKAEDTTPITGVHILHLAQTDNDLFKATCHCGQWSWARVTRERARDVHDLHLRNVGGVSS
jgi:hypothetical protein